jgi:hypothetical protein
MQLQGTHVFLSSSPSTRISTQHNVKYIMYYTYTCQAHPYDIVQ